MHLMVESLAEFLNFDFTGKHRRWKLGDKGAALGGQPTR